MYNTPKFESMPRTRKCLLPSARRILVHNCHMGWQEKKKKSCSIFHCPSFVTTRSFDVGIWVIEAIVWILGNAKKTTKNIWIRLKLDHGRIHAPSDDEGNKMVVQATHYIELWQGIYIWQPIMIVYPILCNGKLHKDSHFHIFGLDGYKIKKWYRN